MKSNFNITVTKEEFFKDCNNFKNPNNPYYRSYLLSYPEFLKYFKNLKTPITKHDLIIGINFTYGWMPRIFVFHSDNFNEALEILNNAKKGTLPTKEQLEILTDLLDHSLIGISKLLHFINPEQFAIWDSRVYQYLTKSKKNTYIQNSEAYLSYLTFLQHLTAGKEYEFLHNEICYKIDAGYIMTKYRTAELVMYFNG